MVEFIYSTKSAKFARPQALSFNDSTGLVGLQNPDTDQWETQSLAEVMDKVSGNDDLWDHVGDELPDGTGASSSGYPEATPPEMGVSGYPVFGDAASDNQSEPAAVPMRPRWCPSTPSDIGWPETQPAGVGSDESGIGECRWSSPPSELPEASDSAAIGAWAPFGSFRDIVAADYTGDVEVFQVPTSWTDMEPSAALQQVTPEGWVRQQLQQGVNFETMWARLAAIGADTEHPPCARFNHLATERIHLIQRRRRRAPPVPQILRLADLWNKSDAWACRALGAHQFHAHWPTLDRFTNSLLDRQVANPQDNSGDVQKVWHRCAWKLFCGVEYLSPCCSAPGSHQPPFGQCLNGLLFPSSLFPSMDAQQKKRGGNS